MCLGFYIIDINKSLRQNVMLVITLFTNIGYLSLAASTNLAASVFSNNLIYLGGCFIPILYFFSICDFCHFYLSKKVIVPLLILQILIYISSLTIGFNDWFYKSFDFRIINGIGCIVNKQYGNLHKIFVISLCFYFVASLAIVNFSVLNKEIFYRKGVYLMLTLLAVSIIFYFIQRFFDFKINTMPIIYIVAIFGALIPVYNSSLYTVSENKDFIHEEMDKIGFIAFDKKMRYMNSNKLATNLFPELKECEVGKRIKAPSKELQSIILNLLNFHSKVKKSKKHSHVFYNTLVIGEKFFDTEIHTLENFVKKRVGYAFELKDTTEHHKIIQMQEKFNEQLKSKVEIQTQKVHEIQNKIIIGMAQIVESRDLSTGEHIERTSDIIKIFAKKLAKSNLGFSKKFLNYVVRSAPMHDLGKIGVDDEILRKPGKFTQEEYDKVKTHTIIGGYLVNKILSGIENDEFVTVAYNVARFHHEKWNGEGYPDGLKGEQIPVEARIMALADVFDALVSKRCYKESFSYQKAFEIIQEESGTHFDPSLAKVFLTCKNELVEYYDKVFGRNKS